MSSKEYTVSQSTDGVGTHLDVHQTSQDRIVALNPLQNGVMQPELHPRLGTNDVDSATGATDSQLLVPTDLVASPDPVQEQPKMEAPAVETSTTHFSMDPNQHHAYLQTTEPVPPPVVVQPVMLPSFPSVRYTVETVHSSSPLILGILLTVLFLVFGLWFCLPCTCAAVSVALKIKAAEAKGNIEKAKLREKQSLRWSRTALLSVVLGVVLCPLCPILLPFIWCNTFGTERFENSKYRNERRQ